MTSTVRSLSLSLAYFLVLLDTTVLTIALPDVRATLSGSLAGQQWAVNAYTVAFAASLLVGGAVADRYGAARTFRLGVGAFGLISLACALSPTLEALVALRALLGVAGALCLGGSLGLIAQLYPDAAERARAMGVWAAATGSALAVGPLVGGLLVDLAGWRAIFLINPPLAALGLLAAKGVVSPRGTRRIDWAVQSLACAFLALLAQAVTGRSPIAGAVAVTMVVLLVVVERRSHAPALPGGLLRAAWPELLAGTVANFAFSGALFVLTLLLQEGRHLTPSAAGLAFLPLTLPMTVNPLLTGRIVARYGARPPILAGLVLLAAGLAGVACGDLLVASLIVTGLGLSFCLPALVAGVVAAAPPGTAGTAGGVLNAARQVGATLGVAVLGGIGDGLLVAAGLVAVTAVVYAAGSARRRVPAG
ncbi:MFS transporter [Microtetraspora sp. AC03309]|uniref:MFS transporter n=1 Tax=Microtetraspora sp. AC03309 TaxID=2779376 RepID=UPI001E38015B|nr:MFS transporter [Microtetraspora sp. AC03309]MCC5581710.1 MFS transporter [Microtetraspora sp. AC03309]